MTSSSQVLWLMISLFVCFKLTESTPIWNNAPGIYMVLEMANEDGKLNHPNLHILPSDGADADNIHEIVMNIGVQLSEIRILYVLVIRRSFRE